MQRLFGDPAWSDHAGQRSSLRRPCARDASVTSARCPHACEVERLSRDLGEKSASESDFCAAVAAEGFMSNAG